MMLMMVRVVTVSLNKISSSQVSDNVRDGTWCDFISLTKSAPLR